MFENEVASENKNSDDIDISAELSTIVDENILPSRVAKRLQQKLIERNVKINKNQLQMIVDKIRDIMRTYAKTKRLPEKVKSTNSEPRAEITKNENMQNLIEVISKLQDRISNIEKGDKQKVVTTDDIRVPKSISGKDEDWKLDPLNEIPNDPESVIILMKWLQYLIDKCGHPNLSNILNYYVDIGWLSQDIKISLIDYSQGITEDEKEGEIIRRDVTDLPSKDHIQSLIFIQKLKGRQFDKHFIDRIDNEISRIIRKLDNYQIK
jgi:flagellar protein FlaD